MFTEILPVPKTSVSANSISGGIYPAEGAFGVTTAVFTSTFTFPATSFLIIEEVVLGEIPLTLPSSLTTKFPSGSRSTNPRSYGTKA